MEETCKRCRNKADYICVCVEKHLCDSCLLNHVSTSTGHSHRPVSLAHPLLTLLMEPETTQHLPSTNSIRDQITKLASFKAKSISMIDKKINQLLNQSEKNSLRKSVNKTNDTMFKVSSGLNSRVSPAPGNRSEYNKSPMCRADLSPEPRLGSRLSSEIHYKIIITGDTSVGKTTLMATFKAFCSSSKSSGTEKATGSVKVENNIYHLDLWDLSGKDKYSELNKLCLYRAVGAIILFDLVDEVTLWTIEQRMQDFAQEANVLSVIALVGNKLDLTVKSPKKRHISYEKGQEIAAARGMFYDEINSKNPKHVSDLFKRISREIFKRKVSSE